MTNLTQKITKGALGTVAAGAMALAFATPAMANDRNHRDRNVDAGDVIAGALVIGGIAALAGAFDGKKDRRHRDRHYNDRRYHGTNYNNRHYNNGNAYNRGGGQRAIERCVRVAERQARRFGGYRYADVTQIRDVERTRYGFRVKGRLEVQGLQVRGHGYGNQGFDRGRFTCYSERGNRPQVDFRGIRGL